MIEIQPFDASRSDELRQLFSTEPMADRCWCMWFLIPYKDFKANGAEGNQELFMSYSLDEPEPMGLVASVEGDPVGWCALGPRSRYARAVKTPTLRLRTGDDDATWFVPCFFVHPERRTEGVASALLGAAVAAARDAGAQAIEGFPLTGRTHRRSGSDLQTGNEHLFAAAGFEVASRPSNKRVIMRLELET